MPEAPERILVVDDEENMVHFLTKFLRAEGFEVEGAGTGEAALERLRTAPFELVLTDLKLPDADGIEILKAARELHAETVVVLPRHPGGGRRASSPGRSRPAGRPGPR